jgi:hypothetical protein
MSVASMARLAEGDTGQPDSTLQSALRLLTAYVPSEAMAVYIMLLGLLNPPPEATSQDVQLVRLVCYGMGILVAVGLTLITFKGRTLTRREQRRRQLVVAVLAAVAFTTYAAAMPSFFLRATLLSLQLSQWAALLALIVAFVLPSVARLLNVRK